mmetsp:Transcript_13190/g.19196  ORF Transcript_13190/g.19196 Transcript_13190/m.19196 type:complete len:360 (+) Transcript_13190:107-1186(+)
MSQSIQKKQITSGDMPLQRLDAPIDDEDCRFMQSFHPNEAGTEDAMAFFDMYGFIIFRDALSPQQCDDTIHDMLEFIREKNPDTFQRKDPRTWSQGLQNFGMPRGTNCLFRPSLLRIRQEPVIHQCFASVLQKEHIIVNHDRWLLQRATKDIDGNGTNCAEWETPRNIHLDLNPWEYMGEVKGKGRLQPSDLRYHKSRSFTTENNLVNKSMGLSVQGILSLGDITDKSHGGTIVVPGFHKRFEEWVHTGLCQKGDTKCSDSLQYRFGDHDPVQSFAQHVTLRKGSLLIWDQRLAHGSTPNRSSMHRYAVPIRFFDADLLRSQKIRAKDRALVVRNNIIGCGFIDEVTDLGMDVFGLSFG